MKKKISTQDLAAFINAWPMGKDWYMDGDHLDHHFKNVGRNVVAVSATGTVTLDDLDFDLDYQGSGSPKCIKSFKKEFLAWQVKSGKSATTAVTISVPADAATKKRIAAFLKEIGGEIVED